MSERQDQPTRVLDYRNPATGRLRDELYVRMCWPGGVAGGLLLVAVAGVTWVHPMFELALLASVPFACLQVVMGVTHVRDSDGRRHWRVRGGPMALGVVMVLLAIGGAVGSVMAFNAKMERTNRLECAYRLSQIGVVIHFYANDHFGAYPPDLTSLLVDLNPSMFVCPSSRDEKATGPTTQAVVAAFTRPGHNSYVYIGAGMRQSKVIPDMRIIAYERLENHDGDGMNILYGDSSYPEWVDRKRAQYILDELKAGHNPPRSQPGTIRSEP